MVCSAPLGLDADQLIKSLLLCREGAGESLTSQPCPDGQLISQLTATRAGMAARVKESDVGAELGVGTLV